MIELQFTFQRVLIIAAMATALALVGGWVSAYRQPPLGLATAGGAVIAPQPAPPQPDLAAAVDALVSLGVGGAQLQAAAAPPQEDQVAEAPAREETEIDIAQALRRAVTAIERLGPTRARLWVIDPDGSRRPLAVGDEFRDGWRIEQIGDQEIILKKGPLTRHISVFAPIEEAN